MSITLHPVLPKGGANHFGVVRSQQNAADLVTHFGRVSSNLGFAELYDSLAIFNSSGEIN